MPKRLIVLLAVLGVATAALAGCMGDDQEDVQEEREDVREEQNDLSGGNGNNTADSGASAEGEGDAQANIQY